MATRRKPVEIDERLIKRAQDAEGASGRSDSEVVEEALALYLGTRALEDAQAVGGLDEDEANRLALEEVRAVRRSRNDAA